MLVLQWGCSYLNNESVKEPSIIINCTEAKGVGSQVNYGTKLSIAF